MRAFSAEARFGRWCSQQRERARHKADRVVERYQRRLKELEPRPHLESRGTPQAWHRDTASQHTTEYDT